MSGALCEEVSGFEVGRVYEVRYLYVDVEGYDGGVTSASTYMYYDRIVRNTKSCSVLVHRYNDVPRR